MLIVIILATAFSVTAQEPVSVAGPDGIFTQFGTALPDTFEYRLFRFESGSKQKPTLVFTGQKPVSAEELKTRLLNINAKNPVYPMPGDSVIQWLYEALNGFQTIDSIPIYNGIPLFVEAAGLGFYDNTVTPETSYNYRVTVFDKAGHLISSSPTGPVSAPGRDPGFNVKFVNAVSSNGTITLNFSFDEANRPFDFRIVRQAYLQTGYREIFPQKFFYSENGSSFLRITDQQVIPGVIYRYVVTPYDILGNITPCADRVKITCRRDATQNPEVIKFSAQSNEVKRAIDLKWKLAVTESVQSISLFRSEHFDSAYTVISRLPAGDTLFTDRNVDPRKSYHYYLVMHGLKEKFPPSAIVTGMLKETTNIPLPPHNLSINQTSEGNLLTWEKTGTGIEGYYVYRSLGFGNNMKQISSLVPEKGLTGEYIDSVQNLTPGVSYGYAVAAVNNGFSISKKSKTVFAEPITPPLPAPTNFFINRQGNGAFLAWDPMTERAPYLSGYTIYRAEKGNEPVKLNSRPLPYNRNSYLDTSLVRGIKYVYTVRANGTGNSESPSSDSFEFMLPELLPQPPSGIRLTKTSEGGVLSWDAPAMSNIQAFYIYRENSEGGTPEKIAEVPAGTTEYEIIQETPGMYFFTVSTFAVDGQESVRSNEVWLHKAE